MFFVMKRIQAKSLGIEHDGDDMRKRMRVYVCVCVCVCITGPLCCTAENGTL